MQESALSPSRILERLDKVLLVRHVESHSAKGHNAAGHEVLAQLQIGHSNILRDLASFHHYGPPGSEVANFVPLQPQRMESLLSLKTMHANCGADMSAAPARTEENQCPAPRRPPEGLKRLIVRDELADQWECKHRISLAANHYLPQRTITHQSDRCLLSILQPAGSCELCSLVALGFW